MPPSIRWYDFSNLFVFVTNHQHWLTILNTDVWRSHTWSNQIHIFWYSILIPFAVQYDDGRSSSYTSFQYFPKTHWREKKQQRSLSIAPFSCIPIQMCDVGKWILYTLLRFFFAAVLFTKIPFVYIFNQNRPMRLNEFVVIALMLWKWDFNCMLNSFEKN